MSRKLLDDCFLHDKDRMRHDDAIALILERISPVTDVETIVLSQAHGRVLAEQYSAKQDNIEPGALTGFQFPPGYGVTVHGRIVESRNVLLC